MKVRSFTTRLIQSNIYLPYVLPGRPGQLLKSLPVDDIKEILYNAMPVGQGYNYLDGPIQNMAEIFEIKIKNLEKSIPPSVPSRNRKENKKESKKRKVVI